MRMSFHSIPTLDLSLARRPETKAAFLRDLRYALLEVGFLYIKNTGIEDRLIRDVISEGKAFFDLPTEKKLEIEMKNAPSFLGNKTSSTCPYFFLKKVLVLLLLSLSLLHASLRLLLSYLLKLA